MLYKKYLNVLDVHNIEYRIAFGIHVKGHSIVLHRNSLIAHIETFIWYPTLYSDFILVLPQITDFWKEALMLSSLHHPNVVSFYGIVRDGPDSSLATVTEFMINGSLKQFLHKKDR